MTIQLNPEFWKGRRVLLTGHTGFKGVWAALCLQRLGAKVSGISLEPEGEPSLFRLLSPWDNLDSHIVDIRDGVALKKVVQDIQPEIVIHMAAQALVRRSYVEPFETMMTNVMGTLNLLESLRYVAALQCALIITSDKVYRNDDTGTAFDELAPLGGDDPYSASKAAAEIVTWSWARSFFDKKSVVVATARAGNVLGGGDFSEDRIVPDIWRAVEAGRDLILRYPRATRPWQHVLDLTSGYFAYVEALIGPNADTLARSLNFGPAQGKSMNVESVAGIVLDALGAPGRFKVEKAELAEKTALSINAERASNSLNWAPRLDMMETMTWTAEWYKRFRNGEEPQAVTSEQIERYLEMGRGN